MGKTNRRPDHQAEKRKDREFKQQLRRAKQIRKYGDEDWKKDWIKFAEQLKGIGLAVKDVAGDGNCMFRALADQIDGDPSRHDIYRQRVCDFIENHAEDFAPFVEDDKTLDAHISEMRKNGTWGGHMELQAASLSLNCNICIHQLAQPRWEIVNFVPNGKHVVKTIHLSYHDGDHYASIRNLSDDVNHVGPPTPIVLASSVPGSSSTTSSSASYSISTDSDATWQEDLVMRSTVATNVYFVRAVLLECGGDVDSAVEFIISLCSDGTLDEEFQNEFALEHGIFPEGGFDNSFSPSFEHFDNSDESAQLAAALAESTLLQQSQNSDQNKKNKPKQKKKVETASSSSSSTSSPHPKLEKFYQNQHLSNKQRATLKRMEKEKPPTVTPTPPVPTPNTADENEAVVDVGSLRI